MLLEFKSRLLSGSVGHTQSSEKSRILEYLRVIIGEGICTYSKEHSFDV